MMLKRRDGAGDGWSTGEERDREWKRKEKKMEESKETERKKIKWGRSYCNTNN